ncbi:hypothetical protein [Veronia pacifica]|uniref:hypothetical protein n=1 Tax=Veronia pacifica TaxID=1080227 RepID=UPI001585DAF6|nr:hypothetical protein [Veronia pacifica]
MPYYSCLTSYFVSHQQCRQFDVLEKKRKLGLEKSSVRHKIFSVAGIAVTAKA